MEAVFAVAAPTTGRGRPQLIYKLRIPNNKTIADQYLALINIMAQHLEDSAGSHAKQLAQQIGREAGARLIDEGFSSANIQEAGRRVHAFLPICEQGWRAERFRVRCASGHDATP